MPEPVTESTTVHPDVVKVQKIVDARNRIHDELRKRIIGQHEVIDLLLTALFSKGHCLFIGVPGLAKTLLISTLAQSLNLSFNRIQFTPDLMPSDITGTDVLEGDVSTGRRVFRFVKGPVFSNILLADEINRTPPKTQAALLQAMQEYHVTASGTTYPLSLPFLVFATQNPIEQEGTYPLPEAQLDRFMFSINIRYPSEDEEIDIVKATTSAPQPQPDRVLTPEEIISFQDLVLKVPTADFIIKYAVKLARFTRPEYKDSPDFVQEFISWGAGPRASQYLILGAKSRAILNGRYATSIEDVKTLAMPVLKHRLILNFRAEAEKITTEEIIRRLIEIVKV
jgi:MoxR-like ATPase